MPDPAAPPGAPPGSTSSAEVPLRTLLAQAAEAQRTGNRALAVERLLQAKAVAAGTRETLPRSLAYDLGVLLFELRRYDEALVQVREGLVRQPGTFALNNLCGVLLKNLGRYPEAVQALERAAKAEPTNVAPLVNLANTHLMTGDGPRAVEVTERLCRREPRNGEHQRLLGAAKRMVGESDAALACFRRARELDPRNLRAWVSNAGMLDELGRSAEALELLAKAPAAIVAQQPVVEARAALLRRAGRADEVQAMLTELRQRFPDQAWIAAELGRGLLAEDRDQGNALLRQALAADPGNTALLTELVDSLDRTRGPREAEHIAGAYDLAKRRVAMGGDLQRDSRVIRNVLHRSGDYAAASAIGGFEQLGEYWTRTGQVSALHYHMAQAETPAHRRLLVEYHRRWGRAVDALAAQSPLARPAIRGGRAKLRVGLMSSDLRNHPVTYFALPLIDLYDRSRFELYCYSFNSTPEDQVQAHIRTKVDGFRLAPGIGDREAAQLIADDDLDLLFELGGTTHMNKLKVMAWRPARLQASWLGYPHSAGLESIDHILVDPHIRPEDPALLIEKPFLMARSWVVLGRLGFDPRAAIEPGTPEQRQGRITFGTMNNPYKYNPACLKLWAQVVAQVEDSHFLFVRPEACTPAFQAHMRAAFAAEGVAQERLEFEAIRALHLPHYNRIDIALDTLPQTGGTTTCEALWMGVPTVTLVGEAFFERLSHSNLINAGLPGLSCYSPAAYLRTAVELAKDRDRRTFWRHNLRAMIRGNPLGRQDWWVEDFQDAVVKAVETA
jgi:predicted O-linked N-acetylglucosamine transferase (SPINDLY family)